VIAVALLPDMKKVIKIQQWVSFISQGRGFSHATDSTKEAESTPNDNHPKIAVQTLEIISTEADAKAKPRTSHDEFHTLFSDSVWSPRLETAEEEVRVEKLARAEARDRLSRSIPLSEYEFYEECSKASFTKPNKRGKFEQFMQGRCMGSLQAPLAFSPMAVDVMGLLARELLEDIVVGALEKRIGTQKKSLEPVDILMYLKGISPQK